MSATMTRAPSSPKRHASASPMPCPAPVMIATLSLRRIAPSLALVKSIAYRRPVRRALSRRAIGLRLARLSAKGSVVIPGLGEAESPESMNAGLWNMDSGLAAPLGARVRAPVGWRIFDAPERPGMTSERPQENYDAFSVARPEPDRDTGTPARHARFGARDRAARLCPDPGVELLRQYGAMHWPCLGDRAHFLRDRNRADLFTDRRGVRAYGRLHSRALGRTVPVRHRRRARADPCPDWGHTRETSRRHSRLCRKVQIPRQYRRAPAGHPGDLAQADDRALRRDRRRPGVLRRQPRAYGGFARGIAAGEAPRSDLLYRQPHPHLHFRRRRRGQGGVAPGHGALRRAALLPELLEGSRLHRGDECDRASTCRRPDRRGAALPDR